MNDSKQARRGRPMSVYAYVHTACGHLASEHRLFTDASSVEGPYECAHCECRMHRDDPQHGLTKAEFDKQFGVEWVR